MRGEAVLFRPAADRGDVVVGQNLAAAPVVRVFQREEPRHGEMNIVGPDLVIEVVELE